MTVNKSVFKVEMDTPQNSIHDDEYLTSVEIFNHGARKYCARSLIVRDVAKYKIST